MKVKKFLAQQANSDRQQILDESNKTVYKEILAQAEKNPAPKKSFSAKNAKWMASAAAVCLTAVILVCVFIFSPVQQTPVYLENNFVENSSTVEEMDSDFKEFDFSIDISTYSVTISKITDSISGDTIYYTATINRLDTLINFNFVAVCNPYYTYQNFDIDGGALQADLPKYTVTYQKNNLSESINEYNLYLLNFKAKIQKGNEQIYITRYSEYADDENSSFLKVIQETII